jgi:hypothetical protein
MKFTIPPGVIISAGGYRTFTEADFNANTNDPNSFALGSKGDSVYLFSGNGLGLSGYVHGFDFGAAEQGVSFGRYVDSTGDDHFVAQVANTLGATNAGPLVGPVVISEINYHPLDLLVQGTNGFDNLTDEFIELQNITAAAVNLFDASHPSNTWHLREGVEFDLPPNVTIPAGRSILVVGFDPINQNALNGFRQRTGTPLDVPIYGPWKGILQNDHQTLELRKPRTPEIDGSVAYILVERIEYTDSAPWPTGADGLGVSLQRKVVSSYGNDPANWAAAAMTPGSGYVGGEAPVITAQPGDQLAIPGNTFHVNVSASGSNLRYQWRFNGEWLSGATNADLLIPNIQLNQYGVYNVLVYNGAGYSLGSNFTVYVQLRFLTQPHNATNVVTGTTTNFNSFAVGTGPVTYQWYYNGNPITNLPSATTTNLILTNIQTSQQGSYYCVARDNFLVVQSDVVNLSTVVKPAFILQPATIVTAVEGGSAVFTVAVSGSPPFSFRWRTNGFNVNSGIIISGVTNSTLIMTNLSFGAQSNRVSASVTNLSGTVPTVSANGTLVILADTDRDGLPNTWEFGRPGFSTNNAADGLRDDDNDGMSNAAEYFAGTDYLDANSNLKLQNIGAIGRMQFTAVSNHTYTVQYTDRLNPIIWNKLVDILPKPTTHIETVIDPNATTNRFYRVATPIQR